MKKVLDTAAGGLDFPIDFPCDFGEEGTVTEKFHLENLGRWKNIQFKFTEAVASKTLTFLGYALITTVEEYQPEVD